MTRKMILLLIALLAAPASVQAACKTSNFVGTWAIYAATNDAVDFWFRCKLTLNSTGRPAGGDNFCKVIAEPKSSFYAGLVTAGKTCRVTGFFAVFGEKHTIDQAWMTRNKESFSGVGHTPSMTFTFTAIRL